MTERATIMEADITGETIASESESQPANRPRLLKQQNFMLQPSGRK